MGKGFNNYMCKKFFHPASRDNLKRVWMAEQKADAYKKKQEELRVQYEKEQDLYTNKAMLSSESKDKLSVNFLYEPPPGAKKEREKEDDEPEYKFEWQRRFNAPREDYCKGDSEIRDQPFGIQVRNVRCIKCHKWGHINTDKECPLYNQSITAAQGSAELDTMTLVQQMRDDGLALKRSALALQTHMSIPSQAHNLIASSDEEEDADKVREEEMKFLKALSTKQKQKLLKKLERLEKGKTKKKKDKKKKRKKKCKKSRDSDSDSESSSDSEQERSRKRMKKSKKSRRRDSSSSSTSSSVVRHKHKRAKTEQTTKVSVKAQQSKGAARQEVLPNSKEEQVKNWLREVRSEIDDPEKLDGLDHFVTKASNGRQRTKEELRKREAIVSGSEGQQLYTRR